MRKTRGWLCGVVLMGAVAHAEVRPHAEVGLGGGAALSQPMTAGVAEAAVGASGSFGATLLAGRLEGAFLAGRTGLHGYGVGPGLVVRQRLGEGEGWSPWVGGAASVLFGPLFFLDVGVLLGPRLSVEAGVLHRDQDGRGISLGVALRWYGLAGVVSAGLTVSTGW